MSSKTHMSQQNLSQHILSLVQDDNHIADKINKRLIEAIESDSKKRPVYENITAIYFMDLLKFFSGVAFRQREMTLNEPSKNREKGQISKRWPYLLKREIEGGFELDQFDWGHSFTITPNLKVKKFLSKLLALYNFCRGGAVASVAITENALSLERIKLAFHHRINLDVIDLSDVGKVPIIELEAQLDDLDEVVKDLIKITPYPFDADTASVMMRNHIKANCIEGAPPKPSEENLVIAGSGCSIENRLMSSMARHHGMRVVNIFHGGSYGVQTKPSFNQGEKLMATDLAVFGKTDCFSGDQINFINGNFDKVSAVKQGRKIVLPMVGDRLMYVPTSLRGENKRYGPFEDMADSLYLKIWIMMREIFGPDLMIKLHPKNNETADIAPPIITEQFEHCLGQADTFIFDYVSTAFTLAASTDKPIVYFDSGLQNFTEDGLKAIKSRCIYYDMSLNLPHSFDDVVRDAKLMTFNHDYVDAFVSAEGQASLDEELFLALAKLA